MIRFLLTIVVLFAGMTAEAQQSTVKRIYPKQEQKSENRSERRKAERKQRQSEKFIQAEIDSINYANALQALENLDFVLEADQLVFKRGMSVFVSTTTNFISVQNDKAVVQIAPFNAGGGPNGVGGITVAGRIFYFHNRAGHQETDLRRAIEQSCNPYFVKLGQAAGGEQILGMAKALGFGRSTELAPGLTAAAGTLPTESDLQNLHELANFSFGQGKLTATPVQIAAMVSAVANGGMAVTPKLVLGTTSDGQTVDYQQQPAAVRVFSEQTAAILREDMIGVVEEGSAPLAKPKEGGAGGKTASAQTGQYDEEGEEIVHALFSGFFPAQRPKYAVVTLIEGGEFGGQVASPLFQQIADTYGPVGE